VTWLGEEHAGLWIARETCRNEPLTRCAGTRANGFGYRFGAAVSASRSALASSGVITNTPVQH
jgi:hypothetical protein